MKKAVIYALVLACVITNSGCGQAIAPSKQSVQEISINKESAVVSFLGPEGTYTQEACGVFFDKKGTYIPFGTVREAVDALEQGTADYAVIPQENTIGGAVTDYVDIVVDGSQLSVMGEIELPINQNLLVMPGASLNDIKTVYSHKQGISQGKNWIDKNIPDAEVVEVSSTAEGAKMVSEGNDMSCAAIASAACADVYGLELLAAGIQENSSNKTRFYVLSTGEPVTKDSDRTAFIASGSAEDLTALMSNMDSLKIKLVAIHDRPLKTELGNYNYLIECSNCSYQNYLRLSEKSQMTLRFLGCFDVI